MTTETDSTHLGLATGGHRGWVGGRHPRMHEFKTLDGEREEDPRGKGVAPDKGKQQRMAVNSPFPQTCSGAGVVAL